MLRHGTWARINTLVKSPFGSETLPVRCYSKRPANHYELLQISPKASQEDIKSAYYRVSKSYHPDLNTDKDAKAKFLQLNEAYKILSNVRYRSDYDRGLFGASHAPRTFDNEYQDFLKKRDAFKKRSQNFRTGKTSHFDYDKFYRMHYGDSIKQNYEERRQQQEWERRRRSDGQQMSTTFSLYLMFISSLFLVAFFTSR